MQQPTTPKRTTSFFFIVIFTILAFNMGYLFGQSPLAPVQAFGQVTVPADAEEAFEPFWEVWELVQNSYYAQPIDSDVLAEGAINGMLAALDDEHTRYLSPVDEAAARENMAGELQGIGAEVSNEEGRIMIVSPFPGSPAEAAGLKPGDFLLAANGTDLTGMEAFEAASIVRGPAGTTVTLLIEREGEQFELDVVRDTIHISSATGEMLDNNIAYIRLNQFGSETAIDLDNVIEELMPQNPVGMVLDLRRNPGGSLGTVIDIADQFLDEGVVLVEEFGNGRDQVYRSSEAGMLEDIPLVVLIDEGSASAAEVLAGAIRDHGRGVLIGQTTYGKGTVQSWHQLSNSGGVRITVARWLTPDDTWVHEEGLEPDYFIPLPEVSDTTEYEDTQLEAAIDFLLGNDVISIPPEETETTTQ